MPSSQDHKAVGEGDTGPNTGGMGAYSPAPVLGPELERQALDQAIYPVVRGLAAEGHPFTGILYAGLMIAPDGQINVLEYNVRFGDPECQALLMRLESDLAEILLAAAKGGLHEHTPRWDRGVSVCVVLTSQGYPGKCETGKIISGLDAPLAPGVKIFHAATALRNGQLVSHGGRVLGVCARADTLSIALRRAYESIAKINFAGMYYRRDIGHRAEEKIQVGIIMGSSSDWEVMQGAREILRQLRIGHEVKILSAHRTPDQTLDYVRQAASRGLQIIIAGAGWAAHLAGTAAANTLLPVIGVPIDSSPLSGLDALLATVQMPPGVPVATMAIGAGGARNAAFLAAQILALQDRNLAQRLEAMRKVAAQKILDSVLDADKN
jgi:phosphoribosylamine--glycine ligase